MANCENCFKADVCRYYEPKSTVACEHYFEHAAAPVVHGHWTISDIPNSTLCVCSACGYSCGAYTYRYCPNCGAKMDKGGNE